MSDRLVQLSDVFAYVIEALLSGFFKFFDDLLDQTGARFVVDEQRKLAASLLKNALLYFMHELEIVRLYSKQ